MMLYQCDIHDQDFNMGQMQGCITCCRILDRIRENGEVSARTPKIYSPKGRMNCYWPKSKRGGQQGFTIEHLGDKPINVATKQQKIDAMKRVGAAEAG